MNIKSIINILFISLSTGMVSAQSSDCNYKKIVEMLNSEGTDSIVAIQYYDVAGRATETVTNTRQGKFLHALNSFDPMGRVSRTWLPVATTSEDAFTEEAFKSISSQQYADPTAYTSALYDALSRTVFSSSPGRAWADKGKTIEYGTNPDSLVKYYTVPTYSYDCEELNFDYYPKGTLAYTKAISEDGQTITTYKDLSGNVVLERRGANNDTYYVYSYDGKLRYVLQPKYQECPDLSRYAFQYSYDGEGRVNQIKIPGCETILYWYDSLDRLIRMQDGLLRANGKFRTYEYDDLGRMTRQSISKAGERILEYIVEYDEIRNFYDTYEFLSEYSGMIPDNAVDDTNLDPLNCEHGYGQLTGTWQRASNGEPMLTTFSYDDHGRLIMQKEIGIDKNLTIKGLDYNFVGDLKYEGFDFYQYDASANALTSNPCYGWITHNFDSPHTKLPTSSVIHITDGTHWMTDTIAAYTYDDFGRVIANNRSGTATDMSFAYDNLHGWVTKIASGSGFEQKLYRETEGRNPRFNGSISAMSWKTDNDRLRRYDYTYDGLNRMTLADYSCYQIGPIIQGKSSQPAIGKELGGKEFIGLGKGETLANVPFTLTLIPQKGGEYEDYSVQYSYDKNSNIESIYRQGRLSFGDYDGYDTVEDDWVVRDGNRLKSYDPSPVADPYYGNMDFVDGANEDTEYVYDGNGNLVQDKNKGLTYEYDLLGHPLKVIGQKCEIKYVYSVDGRKLRTVHAVKNRDRELARITTDYINSFIFKNGKPEMFNFAGGYYSFDGQGALDDCHYYIQDYQGNNRMVVNKIGQKEQINHYYPYGQLMADISTNPDKQAFKYGGKELDRTFGLDLYDFEARQYDAVLPSFTSIDPLAEKYYGISPYAYCGGDPINYVDLHGDGLTIAGDLYSFLLTIYNAVPQGETFFHLEINNGVINPNSIPDSDDPFLSDLKFVASHDQMVYVMFSDGYVYLDRDNNIHNEHFNTPEDYDDLSLMGVELFNLKKSMGEVVGKSMTGNTGVSLFAAGNANGTKSVGGRNLLIINSKGNLNHRSIGFAHELIHYTQYLGGLPYAHPAIDDYLYPRMNKLIHRLGYDY